MGSGCTSSSTSFSSFAPTTSDQNVKYTGSAIPLLGICTGDMLNEVEAALINAIVNYSTGVGINIPDIDLTACALFAQFVGCCATSCTSLDCLMKIVFDSLCILYNDILTLQTQMTSILSGYNTACLSGVTSSSTLNQVLQELIIEYCALYTQVQTLQSTVNNLSTGLPTSIGNFLAGALQTCQGSNAIQFSGSGATFTATFKGMTPIGGIMPFAGPLTGRFNTDGSGVTGTDMCGWHLCNGNNGSVDLRGYFVVGVNDGSMGSGSQNPEVNNATNPGQNYSVLAHGGEIKHQLVSAEVPNSSISGTLNDPGHDHALFAGTDGAASGNTTQKFNYTNANGFGNTAAHNPTTPARSSSGGSAPTAYIDKRQTGITLAGATVSGGNGKHENRPPYMALYYIQRMS